MITDVSKFDQLPDSALVSVKVFPEIAGIAVSTAWQRAKRDPSFPQPVKLGAKCTRFRVSEIRAFIRGGK